MRTPALFTRRPKALSPWSDFDRMERAMQRAFEGWPSLLEEGGRQFEFAPSCELKETDNQFIVKFDLPGINKEDINIEMDNGILTVSGERREEKETGDEKQRFSETYYGSFTRSFSMPSKVDEENVDATYKDGVLTVKLSKSQPSKSRQVKIS